MTSTHEKQSFGEGGNLTIAAGTQVTGDFCVIQCLDTVSFTTLTDSLERTSAEYGTAASGTITFTDAPVADETFDVNSITYAFKETAVDATDVAIGTGANAAAKAAATAANVAAAVSANDPDVVVTSAAGVATVTAAAKGTAGNAFTLSEIATNTTVSGSGTLEGGLSLTAASSVTYGAGSTLYGKFTVVEPSVGTIRLTVSSPN